MRSTFAGLNTVTRGIYAQQAALDTIGHNVTNNGNEGYSRQRVNVTTTMSETIYSGSHQLQIGTGVDITSITRYRDNFIDQQMWQESCSLGYGETMSDTLGRVEGVFTEPSATGIQTTMDKFWQSWQTLHGNASDDGCRGTVCQSGVAVVTAIQHAAQQLKDINNDLNDSIDIKVNDINKNIAEIASLNSQISKIETSGDHANDLRDRRDFLVDKLSKMINIRCSEDKYGSYTIQSAGRVLVTNDSCNKLRTFKTVDYSVSAEKNFGLEKNYVFMEGSSQKLDFDNGELRALLDARDDSVSGVDAYLNKLNDMSKFLLTDFNEVHKSGYDLNNKQGGNFFGQTGIDYKTSWPPANKVPGTGTWLSQLKVNDDLLVTGGTNLIAAKSMAEITQSNGNGGRAVLTGTYSGTAGTEKYVVKVSSVDASTGRVNGITCDMYNPPTSTTPISVTVTPQSDGSYLLGNGIHVKINDDDFTKTGDTYSFIPIQANGIGDNAVKLSQALKTGMRTKELYGKHYDAALGDSSLDSYYNNLIGVLGVQSQNAQRLTDNQTTLVDQVANRRDQVSGVNMDQEMSDMIRFSKGYNAACRMITTMDEMLDKLINGTGSVGR